MKESERSDGDKEREGEPYARAARFPDRRSAGRSYNRLQRSIRESDAELSAFRFQLSNVWHVAAVGPLQPTAPLAKRIESILSRGEAVELPPAVVSLLLELRQRALRPGTTWMEGITIPAGRSNSAP